MEEETRAKDSTSESPSRKRALTQDKIKERNREHARTSRMRNKVLVENLKRAVVMLSQKCERHEQMKQENQAALLENHASQRRVLQRMLMYRNEGCLVPDRWRDILAEDFTCILPVTPYRHFNPGDLSPRGRRIYGVNGMIRDTASLAQLYLSIGPRHYRGCFKTVISMDIDSVTQERDTIWCRWTIESTNAVANGAVDEFRCKGMLQASFTADCKIKDFVFQFDVLSVTQALSRALGRSFDKVPNTLTMALEQMDDPRNIEACVITSADPPFKINAVNKAWTELHGFSVKEVRGSTLNLVHGPATDAYAVQRLMDDLHNQLPSTTLVLNYHKSGQAFWNYLRMFPLSSTGQTSGEPPWEKVTHYLGIVEPCHSENGEQPP